ncbi:unnamed protein product [Auanema sp. JU1783]|nr:unnamed protein product [Auanema sp. JU1783]
MRMKFRKRIRGTCNDIMKSSNTTCVNEFSSHDGDRSSVRSSDDGASSSPHGGDDRERTKLIAKKNEIMERLKHINLDQQGNVEEFLTLTNKTEAQRGVDNPQMTRIRQQFEKKNKKYFQDSEYLKKKLSRFESRIAAIDNGLNESNGKINPMASVGQGMRRTGAHIKGMTESVVSAPIEFAHRLKSTFGSADNVNEVPG